MRKRKGLTLVVVTCALAMFANQAMAQATKTKDDVKAKDADKVATKKPMQEMITLDIRGSECAACAKVLTTELTKHGVKCKVAASKGKPYRVVTEVDSMTDLGAAGMATMAAKTPHHAKEAPELELVVFAKLDEASAKKATEALAKVKGIDAEHSKADTKKGEISIRLAGGAKVTADSIRKALMDAGVENTFTKSKTEKTG